MTTTLAPPTTLTTSASSPLTLASTSPPPGASSLSTSSLGAGTLSSRKSTSCGMPSTPAHLCPCSSSVPLARPRPVPLSNVAHPLVLVHVLPSPAGPHAAVRDIVLTNVPQHDADVLP
ncbi:hypothetical protein Hypma_007137 [Hypsizygus marmoreus]|uniref:Uncharacterized protein n=1 Tax=Hypsizygus marmoreus TaxID=39966 RepID=A0A369KCB5_HYPMA|nr:hypothetical protein Hypma_007137 [Hypsizygus marmoreus]